MSFILILLALVIFVAADVVIRKTAAAMRAKRERRVREEALAINLRLDFSDQAKSLKRVEVNDPKAVILAVDDEEVVLDSFRKILVLDGYSIDTVESGPEALGLIKKRHYDFVFTDLKMPDMDGVEVCKAAKHLRPDIDVIIITGYASVESAVETMKYGAMDYIQKPFTEDELVDLVRNFVIRREDRIQKQLRPQVHITHSDVVGKATDVDFVIPGGVFISASHCWAGLDAHGNVYVGIDDFARKVIGNIDSLKMPTLGEHVDKGSRLFDVARGTRAISFASPVSGKVLSLNTALAKDLSRLQETVYNNNWICSIEGTELDSELRDLKIGRGAADFYNDEIQRIGDFFDEAVGAPPTDSGEVAAAPRYLGRMHDLKDSDFQRVVSQFFSAR